MNRFEKIGDGALQAWAEILRLLPDAQLFMVVGDVETLEIRAQVENRLSKAGLPIDRVRLHPRTTTGYFQLYHQFDIALDSFPYNGGTTSCDTLAMGVPFIALRGSHAVARVGSSLLATVGLEELAAETPEDYVARTVALARDPERLRALRSGLREQVFDSPLMDHARFAQEMGKPSAPCGSAGSRRITPRRILKQVPTELRPFPGGEDHRWIGPATDPGRPVPV